MKKHLKKIAASVVFMMGLFGILTLLSGFFKPDRDGYNIIAVNSIVKELKTQNKNSLDILFMGDSESYSCYSPVQLWKEQGYTAYNCGSAAQRLCDTYDILQSALNLQNPKMVILETNTLFRFAGSEQNPKDVVSNQVNKVLPIFKYHSKWKAYLLDNMLLKSEFKSDLKNKGFKIRTQVAPYKGGDYMIKTDEMKKIPSIAADYLKKMQELCQKNGVKLILVSSPSASNWNYKKHNGVEAWAKQYNVEYLDLNLLTKELGIDWHKDTKDGGDHLNYAGATKVTKYIGEFLNKTGLFTDHREDPEYAGFATHIK